MTYFSRFMINPQRRGAWKLLRSPQAMHAAVMATLPPDTDYSEGRILWRLDESMHAPVLYMLSPEEPDFSALWSRLDGIIAVVRALIMVVCWRSWRTVRSGLSALPRTR